jgi:hypothetical protein
MIALCPLKLNTKVPSGHFHLFPPALEPTWNIKTGNVTVNTGSVKSSESDESKVKMRMRSRVAGGSEGRDVGRWKSRQESEVTDKVQTANGKE